VPSLHRVETASDSFDVLRHPPTEPPADARTAERDAGADDEWAWSPEQVFNVLVRLSDGELLEVAAFATLADAEARAGELVSALDARAPGVWPRVGNRYIRPETILSVDIAEARAMRWTGSRDRARWARPGAGAA
jgi:hypothetical protein